MYYIFKLSANWSIMDAKTGKDLPLKEPQIELLQSLFPGILSDNAGLFMALEVTPIPANRLMKLPVPGILSPQKKLPEKPL